MNSEILSGFLSSLGGSAPIKQTDSGNKGNSAEFDFVSLLKQRLAADNSMGSENSGNCAGARPSRLRSEYNPLFSSDNRQPDLPKADFRMPEKTNAVSSDSKKEAVGRSDDEKSVATNDSQSRYGKDTEAEKAAASDEEVTRIEEESAANEVEAEPAMSETVQANADSAIDEELARLLAGFTPEDQKALIEVLQQLSPADLEAIATDPEEFRQNLVELIGEMPETEEQQHLLELVESPEFSQLLQHLETMAATGSDISAETTALAQALLSRSPEEPKQPENIASSEQSESAVSQTAVKAGDNPVAADDSNQTVNASGKEKDDEKPESATDEKAATADQAESVEKTGEKDTESLREEFKRVNELDTDNQGESAAADQGDSESQPSNRVTGEIMNPNLPTTENKPVTEEIAKRFLAMLSGKADASGNEKSASHVVNSLADALKKPATAESGTMNGNMGNGFSSHSGNSAGSMQALRQNVPTAATSTIFSEMLEKAEYLKTQNGSKILNIELDPEQLGKIEMELTSRDGTVTARLTAESTTAKAKLEELAPQIKEQLVGQGVNLSEITVDISSKDPDERNSNQMSGGKNKSGRISAGKTESAEAVIRKNVLPNLRRAALNIKAVDLTV
jgi:flagellar hook-length control protein FliK